MPFYLYVNPETQEHKEVLQKMTEPHVYVDENGLEWQRVFTPANFSIDGNINPMSSKEFLSKTDGKDYTMGDIQDKSKEMSEARKEKYGYDPVQKKWFQDYSKKRKGRKHPNDPSAGGPDTVYV